MKKSALVFIMFLSLQLGLVLGSCAQECDYYPMRTGTIIGYESFDGKGKLTGSSRITLQDVVHNGADVVYKVKSENWDDKKKPVGVGEYEMKCENGEFSVDMKSLIDPKSMEGFKDLEVSFSGNDMTYPLNLAVGQTLPDADITMGAATGGITLMSLTIKITNRQVVARENITVPAGTFDCYKITYDVETKVGLKISSSAVQWMNRGAGNVKMESYDKKGKLLGSTVLNEYNP